LVLVSGFLEPVFYLFSIGVGVSKLVGDVTLPGGEVVTYTAFVAPAMLAASAMNGAIIDATFSLFFKLKYNKLYDAVLATPVTPVDVAIGEITWALMRGSLYSISFVGVMLLMGLISSWWAVLTIPAVVLTGYAFAAIGTACTTYMRSWQDFSYITLVQLPIFLFSATFYPITVYPESLQWVVRCSPLYHAATLMRELTTGTVGLGSLVHVAVLVALGVVGMVVTGRRLEKLLLT
jgi:lipooligosaccharide transport system permease protein